MAGCGAPVRKFTVNPVDDVECAVGTQREDIVRVDVLALAIGLHHSDLRQDRHRLQPDRERPHDLEDSVLGVVLVPQDTHERARDDQPVDRPLCVDQSEHAVRATYTDGCTRERGSTRSGWLREPHLAVSRRIISHYQLPVLVSTQHDEHNSHRARDEQQLQSAKDTASREINLRCDLICPPTSGQEWHASAPSCTSCTSKRSSTTGPCSACRRR